MATVGKNILDNLTTGMYSDSKVASVDKGIHNKTTKYGLPTY